MASREEQKRKLREQREAAEKAAAHTAELRKRTAYLAAGVGLIALIVVVSLVLVSQSGDDDKKVETTDVFAGIPQKDITLGDPDAPVTVIEFADLQCPFCRDFAVHDLPGIVKKYVKPGDVKMELRLLAFIGPDSSTGREVAACRRRAEPDLALRRERLQQPGHRELRLHDHRVPPRAGGGGGPRPRRLLALDAAGSPFAQKYADESDSEAQKQGVSSTPSFAVTPEGGETKVVDANGLSGAIDDAIAQAKD